MSWFAFDGARIRYGRMGFGRPLVLPRDAGPLLRRIPALPLPWLSQASEGRHVVAAGGRRTPARKTAEGSGVIEGPLIRALRATPSAPVVPA